MISFQEWASNNNFSAFGAACSRAAWNAAQAAERERIKQIVRDVTEGRSNCNLLLERIDR